MYRSVGNERNADELITSVQAKAVFSDLISGDVIERISELQQKVRAVMIEHGAEHPQSIELLLELAELYIGIEFFEIAEDILRRTLLGCKRTYGLQNIIVPKTTCRLAFTLSRQNKSVEAEQLFTESLRDLERRFDKNHAEVMSSVDGLAYTYQLLHKLQLSEEFYSRLLVFQENALGKEHPTTLQTVNNLANVTNSTKRRHFVPLR